MELPTIIIIHHIEQVFVFKIAKIVFAPQIDVIFILVYMTDLCHFYHWLPMRCDVNCSKILHKTVYIFSGIRSPASEQRAMSYGIMNPFGYGFIEINLLFQTETNRIMTANQMFRPS